MSESLLTVARETYRGWDAWNERMRERGLDLAVITVPPRLTRAKSAWNVTVQAARERVALWIAPWLDPPDF